jgi:ABC-type oligopeptide transport system substrate-binding subunit
MHLRSYSHFDRVRAGLLAAFATVLLAACGTGDRPTETSSDSPPLVLHRGLGGQPASLDPQRAEDEFSVSVLRDLYEQLTASAPDGAVVPAAAESWSVDPDGRRYTFLLRPEARWSNGEPVLARHFVAGLQRAVDPATGSAAADLLRGIENAPGILRGELPPARLGVRAAADHRLEITLARPLPYFPDILTNPVASPVHEASRPGGAITNGPWVLAEIVPGSHLRLARNPSYRDAAAVAFDEVRYEFVANENAEFDRFRAGELDVTYNVPEQRFQDLAADPASGLQHRALLTTSYFTLNTDWGPLHDHPGLREALSLTVDREAITRHVARAGQVPAYSLVPEGVWNYTPAVPDWRGLDRAARLTRARALYAAAGYSPERPLRLRLLYSENVLVQRICVAVAADWKSSLGVEVELIPMEFRAYLAARADPAQWDVVRVGWSADYNDASSFLDTLAADSPQNFGRWTDARYAELLAAAAGEADIRTRRELLQQAEQLMLQQHPVLPVYFYVARRLVRPGLEAPAINPLNRTYSLYFRPGV